MTIRIEQQEPLKIALDNGGTVSVRAISGTGPAGPEGPDGPAGAPGGSDASFAAWILDPDSDTRAAGASVFGPGEFRPEDYGGFVEAAAAAEAYGPRSVVVLSNDTYDITGGFELADMSFTIRGQGAGIVDGVAHGSVLRCVSQTGPVLDLSGYKWPENFIGWAAFEGFMIEGDGTAGITKSGIQNTGALDGIFSAAFRDITIRQTGGPGFAPSQMYLSEVTNLVVETPVSCQANSVPYILASACNGNVWTNVGVRNPSGTTDDCWSGGAFRVVDNGTYAPTNDHFIDCWAEFLHVPTNGALFHLEGNTCQVQDFQNYDCVPEVAATGTSVVRLDAPGVSNYGGNQVTGLIYGAEAGTMLHYGVELKQPNNSVRGVKGYDGNNVHLTSGVGHSIVVLEGRVSSATSLAFDDDSGEITNVLIDLNDGWPDAELPLRLGETAVPNTVLDIDAIVETGLAYFDAPITGTGLPYGVIDTKVGSADYITQFAYDASANNIWMRTKTATVWGSWSQVGNVTLTGTQTLTNKTLTSPAITGTPTGVYYPGGTDVPITDGGTGASTLPTGLLKGAGTGAITAATAGTDYYAPGGTDVPITDGGTGASTLPTGILKGAGTGAITAVTAPSGAVVGTTDSQALTNKDLTAGTNTFPTLNQNTTGSAATLTTSRTIGTLTGDVTTAGSGFNGSANNTNATVLATVNSNVGSFGSATQVGVFTVNGKGLTTAASNTTIQLASSAAVTGLDTALALKAALASPTFSGTPVLPNAVIDEKSAAASGTSGTVTLDLSANRIFTLSPTGNVTTVTISNVPATGRAVTVNLIVTQGGTPRTIATPTGGIFMGAATPTQVASKACMFTYLTVDGGTTWYCSAAVQV